MIQIDSNRIRLKYFEKWIKFTFSENLEHFDCAQSSNVQISIASPTNHNNSIIDYQEIHETPNVFVYDNQYLKNEWMNDNTPLIDDKYLHLQKEEKK